MHPTNTVPAKPGMARVRRARVVGVAAVIAALTLAAWIHFRGRGSLDEFVGRDLRTLSESPEGTFARLLAEFLPEQTFNERKRLRGVLARSLPPDLMPSDQPPWAVQGSFCAWQLWRINSGQGDRLVLFEGQQPLHFRDPTMVRLIFLDAAGLYVDHVQFSIGFGHIDSVSLAEHEFIGRPAVAIQCSHPASKSKRRQWYALADDRAVLLRVEDGEGGQIPNNYEYEGPAIGPRPPPRDADAWQVLLLADDPSLIIEALTWIGGHHLAAINDWPARSVNGPSGVSRVDPARVLAEVRARPRVRQRIDELARADNPWIREAAELAKGQLVGP